jgi:hypothetical protein
VLEGSTQVGDGEDRAERGQLGSIGHIRSIARPPARSSGHVDCNGERLNPAGQHIDRVVSVTGREDAVMTASFGAVVLSTTRPMELAAFYRELLGWIV